MLTVVAIVVGVAVGIVVDAVDVAVDGAAAVDVFDVVVIVVVLSW